MLRLNRFYLGLLPQVVLSGCSFDPTLGSPGSLANPEDGEYLLWALGDTPVDPRAAPGSAATGHGTLPVDYGTADEPVTLVYSSVDIWSVIGLDGRAYDLGLRFCLARVGPGESCEEGNSVYCQWSGTFTRSPHEDTVTLSLTAAEPEVSDPGWICPLTPASWTATYSVEGPIGALSWMFRADISYPQGEAVFRRLS